MFDAVNRNTVFDLQTPTSSHFDEGIFAVFVLECFGIELLHYPVSAIEMECGNSHPAAQSYFCEAKRQVISNNSVAPASAVISALS